MIKKPWLEVILAAYMLCLCTVAQGSIAASLAPTLEQQAKARIKSDSAEVLKTITHIDLNQDGHWQAVHYISVRLNDADAARDYGRITIPFNHYYTDTRLDFANVLAKDGSLSPVAADAVQLRVTGGGQDFYSDSSEYVFSLPDIAPGSVIEFQFSANSKQLALPELFAEHSSPYWFQRKVGGEGWRTDFVHDHHFQISAPQNLPLHYKSYNSYPAKPKITRQGDSLQYQWRAKNISPIVLESYMPPLYQVAAQLAISTQRDWSVVDKWAWDNAVEKFAPTQTLRTLVATWRTQDLPTTEAKARAVYEYLQRNTRYVFAHLGRGGYEPHYADEVISASYGDCKDQTVLGIALLRLLGVEAYPALVETPRAGNSDTELVSLIFDHMMIYIPPSDSSDAIWMDTTGDLSLYPGVSNYLFDQNALIVNGRGGVLTRITEGFEPNYATLTLNYQPQVDGSTEVEAQISTSGYIEQYLRSWWIHQNNRESELDKFLRSLFAPTAKYEYSGRIQNTDNIWQPVSLSARFTFPKQEGEELPVYGAGFNQLFQLFGHLRHLQLPHTRSNSFVDKHPYQLRLVATFNEAPNSLAAVVKSGGDVITDYLELKQDGEAKPGAYTVTFDYQKKPVALTASEYQHYYAAVEKAANNEGWLVSMQPDTVRQNERQLADIKTAHGTQSLAYFLAKARSDIAKADFEAALKAAQKAVEVDHKNGEAWYLLGMAQGFSAMIDDATSSFERAETLGYLP